ncbi:serine hydrolase domain-containing protein [Hydrocarboniphaga sp.]|uniref:serine hydrolase domain-containing protein n=1 Tax=Hydrocarboniphaga sp. TaxID=2033016 RepID=UPI002635E8E2|nr:serine hydrolase domain-containing protein [Hydrocarboniphaga sp.]
MTTRDVAAEVDPESVDMTQAQVDKIWHSIERLYRTGLQPAISLTLRRKGRIVIRRSIGHAQLGDGRRPGLLCTNETPVCLFSASKAITAMLVHKLVEQRQLGLDDRIARFIPEYAAEGKGATTVRHLLAHRAGIPRVPEGATPEMLFDWDSVVARLCAAKPINADGNAQSYHAITGGFILGELAQRISGAQLRDLLRDMIAEPMGLKSMSFGVPEQQRAKVALNYCTGPRSWFPLTTYIHNVLGASFERVTDVSNSAGFMSSVIPAGNIYATSDDAGAFYQMLLQRGEYKGRQIFKPETVAEAIRPAGPIHIDRTLLLPVRFSAGFVLGEWPAGIYGRDCRSAFGHLGFLTTICWADPARDISVGFVNSGKTLSVDQLVPMGGVLGSISGSCKPLARARRTVD